MAMPVSMVKWNKAPRDNFVTATQARARRQTTNVVDALRKNDMHAFAYAVAK